MDLDTGNLEGTFILILLGINDLRMFNRLASMSLKLSLFLKARNLIEGLPLSLAA